MNFKIGDKVRFANAAGGGMILRALESNKFEIEDDLGFVNIYSKAQLLPDKSKPEYFLKPIKTNKDYISKIKSDQKVKVSPTLTTDLHFGENTQLLSHTEIIEAQLTKFQTAINTALANKQKEVVVIHGIGNGTLRNEVHKKLKLNRHVVSYVLVSEGTTKVRLRG